VDILIATGNAGKAREFREMLGADRFVWHDFTRFGDLDPVAETGHTFRANACLKAAGYARQANMWALADDSGLEVDALGGKPGVHSARWAQLNESGSGDADNNATLLRQLAGVPDERRTARFVCVLALADAKGNIIFTARDAIDGRILHAPRGNNGFGYDPLFLVESMELTTAELPAERKHEISHRGKALRRLRDLMRIAGISKEHA
jgi:XTP/dITP diphosphohydrolase